MNKRGIWLGMAILFCLFLIGCSNQERTTSNGRRQAAGGSGSSAESTSNSSSEQARICQQAFGTENLINLVVIVGNRANTSEMPVGGVVDDVFCNLLGRTFEVSHLEAQANVAFVVSDGAPWRAEVLGPNGQLADLRVSANNDYMLSNRISHTISQVILPFMDSEHLMAQHEEADLFEALHVANRILRDMESGRENHILIIDSGITTAGHIDMSTFDILENDVTDEVVNRLEAADLLPDLSHVFVSFFNIGGSAEPQQVPSGPVEAALMTFWSDIIGATGAQVLQMQGRGEGGRPRLMEQGYPFVSLVEFDVPVLDLSDLRSEIFSEESLGFIADGSAFMDETYSKSMLATTAQTLTAFFQSNEAYTIYIVGSQAGGPAQNTTEYALSLERAQRVKALLISEFNLPETRITAVGAGTTVLSWRNTDEFTAGEWRDDLAEQNRVVAIIPSTAVEMMELRSNGLID